MARQDRDDEKNVSSSGFARRGSSSDPLLNKHQLSHSQTEMRPFPNANLMTAPASVPHRFRPQQAEPVEPTHHLGSNKMEHLCAAARFQRPTKWESKLPDIPMSFLLRDGKPLILILRLCITLATSMNNGAFLWFHPGIGTYTLSDKRWLAHKTCRLQWLASLHNFC